MHQYHRPSLRPVQNDVYQLPDMELTEHHNDNMNNGSCISPHLRHYYCYVYVRGAV